MIFILKRKIDLLIFSFFLFLNICSPVEGAGDVLPHGEPEGEDGGQGSRLSTLKVAHLTFHSLEFRNRSR